MRDICIEISGPSQRLNTAGFVGESSTGVIFSHQFFEGKIQETLVSCIGVVLSLNKEVNHVLIHFRARKARTTGT
jgi:hypothetical protein